MNLIGWTISLTSEKSRPTNHRPQPKYFSNEKDRIGFPVFQEGFPSQWWMNKTRSSTQLSLFLLSRDFLLKLFKVTYIHWRNSSKAKKTNENTHTPNQSSTECRFTEWSTSIQFTLFVRIFINMASLFTAVVIHGDQFSISINSLRQSTTLAVPETEESLLRRSKKRLKALDS